MHAVVDVVVEAVGVVVGDDDGGAGPVRCLLQGVDLVGDELLLIQRVGVAGVPVLISGGLQEAISAASYSAIRANMPKTSLPCAVVVSTMPLDAPMDVKRRWSR